MARVLRHWMPALLPYPFTMTPTGHLRCAAHSVPCLVQWASPMRLPTMDPHLLYHHLVSFQSTALKQTMPTTMNGAGNNHTPRA